MTKLHFLLASALSLAAGAQAQPSREDAPIIVNAERIQDLRARLRACLARNCPPNEDVDATLALTEGEFINGDYNDAAESIEASIARNRRHSRTFPEPVADLYRSYARVQGHMGHDPQAARATRNVLAALREGIPREDHRHFTARLEMAELLMRTGDVEGARRELRMLAQKARAGGRDDIARAVDMRLLRIEALLNPRGAAFRSIERMSRSSDPARRFEVVSAKLFLAHVYRRRGEIARADAMLAAIPRSESDRRQLLVSPDYQLAQRAAGDAVDRGGGGNVISRLADDYRNKWVDVSYWIQPDGRVSGLEVVRQGASTSWAEPLLASIRGRVYSPSSDPNPSYRLERYSYTAPYEDVTGTRMQRRSQRARVEMLDLTTQDEPGRAPDAGVSPRGN